MKTASLKPVSPVYRLFSFVLALFLTPLRIWAGYLWFTELGWKAPWVNAGFGCDTYRFNPPAGQEAHGLCDWMQREVQYPTLQIYGSFVRYIVIPNFDCFAWLTTFMETYITISLVLGILTRLGGLIGAFWGLSLLVGLVSVPGENLAIYLFYVFPPALFAVIGARSQFSVDAFLAKKYQKWGSKNNSSGKLLKLATGAKPRSAGVI